MKKTVLIADDVPFVRKTLTDILTKAHFQVIGEASDGKQAVDLFKKLRPDVVTMDIVMPVMSGIEATKAIMSHDKDAKVVILSAMGQENLVMDAINVGAKDFILKPFTTEEILRTLDRAIRGEERTSGIGGKSASSNNSTSGART